MKECEITVSIAMLTFNHAKYIREALDAILLQKVNFRYEVVVGDDCSSDETQNILKSYAQKYPDKFVLLLRKSNIGATKNYFDVLKHCKGKYIALLEGDDFWTDENKLQIQTDFLESNKNCDAVAHRHEVVNFKGESQYLSHKKLEVERYFDKKSAQRHGANLCHPNTLVFRNFFDGCADDYTIIRDSNQYGAHSLMIYLLASKSDIYIMKRCMSSWRKVVSDKSDNFTSFAERNPLLIKKNALLMYINFRNYFGKTYDFSKHITELFVETLICLLHSEQKEKFKEINSLFKKLKIKERIMVPPKIGRKIIKSFTPRKIIKFIKRKYAKKIKHKEF